MAELTTTERLQPSLLDRLTDAAPSQREESREQRVISATRLRECVIRDLSWLLNAVNLETSRLLEAHPQVRSSVLNYGIPDLAGVAVAGIDAAALQQRIREAILAFEPRLIPRRCASVCMPMPHAWTGARCCSPSNRRCGRNRCR